MTNDKQRARPDTRPRRHFPARDADVVGQLLGEVQRWKRDKSGRAPSAIEVAPDVARDLARELDEIRGGAHEAVFAGELDRGVRTFEFAGIPVTVDDDRAPRGVVLV